LALNGVLWIAPARSPRGLQVSAPQAEQVAVSEQEISWISNGSKVSSLHFSSINSMIATHSKDTSLVFLALPG
jgi:hypothetical protein